MREPGLVAVDDDEPVGLGLDERVELRERAELVRPAAAPRREQLDGRALARAQPAIRPATSSASALLMPRWRRPVSSSSPVRERAALQRADDEPSDVERVAAADVDDERVLF